MILRSANSTEPISQQRMPIAVTSIRPSAERPRATNVFGRFGAGAFALPAPVG